MIKTGICRNTIKLNNKRVNLFRILRQGAKIARSRNTSTITSKRTAKMMEMNLWETLTMWPRRMQTRVMRKSTSVKVDMQKEKEEKGAAEVGLYKAQATNKVLTKDRGSVI